MNEICEKCGALMRHHYVTEETIVGSELLCPLTPEERREDAEAHRVAVWHGRWSR